MQVLLPESRHQILQIMKQMCEEDGGGAGSCHEKKQPPPFTPSEGSGWATGEGARAKVAAATGVEGGEAGVTGHAESVDDNAPLAAVQLTGGGWKGAPPHGSGRTAGGGEGEGGGGGGVLLGAEGFWQRFARDLTIQCVTEIKYSLLGHSLMGCPGLVTLVTNLVRGVDEGDMLPGEVR